MFIKELKIGDIVNLQNIGILIVIEVIKPIPEDKWINNNFIKFWLLKPEEGFDCKFIIGLYEYEINSNLDKILTT